VRLVDLSAPIEPSPAELPEALRTDIEYVAHDEGAAQAEAMLGVPRDLLRDGEGWAVETFTRFGTHNSTHVDAPWHYNSTISGRPAQTIDELPLEWFYGPGVVIDATDRADGDALSAADVEERLPRPLEPLDIVLVRTGRDEFYGELDYIARGPGVTAEATQWLYDRGVRVSTPLASCNCRRSRPILQTGAYIRLASVCDCAGGVPGRADRARGLQRSRRRR